MALGNRRFGKIISKMIRKFVRKIEIVRKMIRGTGTQNCAQDCTYNFAHDDT